GRQGLWPSHSHPSVARRDRHRAGAADGRRQPEARDLSGQDGQPGARVRCECRYVRALTLALGPAVLERTDGGVLAAVVVAHAILDAKEFGRRQLDVLADEALG